MLSRVRAGGLLAERSAVLVLLSGGRDSTCLLDLAVRIAGPAAVTALHVNYGLREEADGDERHCAELCRRLEVALELRRPRRPERGNVQAWARKERYSAAAQIALELGGDMAAGHTATDQVETILYRLASSPSRRALLGMRPREGMLVRPLLRFTREDTAAYCTERGLRWREDASNDSRAYARARVRGELVPALRSIHPAAEQNVLALAELLRDEADVLDGLLNDVLGGRGELPIARLRELPAALGRLLVQRLADGAAGGPAPGAARRLEEILALEAGSLDLPHGVRANVSGGLLRFGRTPPLAREAKEADPPTTRYPPTPHAPRAP